MTLATPLSSDRAGAHSPVALVTGAGSADKGIGNGRAAAILLARRGYTVMAVDVQVPLAQQTVEMIEAEGGTAVAAGGDVSPEDDVRAIVEAATELPGPLTALVNNVGITDPPGNAVDIDMAGWQRAFEVNVTSMVLTSRHAIPHLIAAGGGSIVNVSSLAGTISHPHIAYATTKGAVISLTKSIAVAYGNQGVRANTVVPGMAYTPIVSAGIGISEESRRRRAQASPLKTEGTGWDIGRAITYLATEESHWVTGITMPVDAGFSADLRLDLGY